MARLASINKNNRKKDLAKRYYKHREELRRQSVDPKLSEEEKQAARVKLQKLPRRTSHVQVVNRCMLTGRARGNYRKFGLCRLKFRELALLGKLPGVTKASW
jgi:small subunit ribosomal protein S14